MISMHAETSLLDPDTLLALAAVQADLIAIETSVPGAQAACAVAERAFTDAFFVPSNGAWARAAESARDVVSAVVVRAELSLTSPLSAAAAAALDRLRAFAAENGDLIERRMAHSSG